MPLYYPGGAGVGAAIITDNLDPGIIVHISAFTSYIYLQSTLCWIEIGISDTPFSLASRHYSLITDYITVARPLHWDGHIPIQASSILYLSIRGDLIPDIHVHDIRITPTLAKKYKAIYAAITS